MFISWMLIKPSFKKSLIVEQFQGNYLKWADSAGKCSIFSPNNLFHLNFPTQNPVIFAAEIFFQ